jgi:hypothetical protein
MSIQTALLSASDPYAPSASNPSLQQYDNYQIYDLHCVDIVYSQTINGVEQAPFIDRKKQWLAVQVFDPSGIIPCNFAQIVLDYP